MPTPSPTFGQLIREAWSKTRITQTAFALRLGVAQPRVCEIFRQASMTEALFRRCAKALGFRVDVRLVRERRP